MGAWGRQGPDGGGLADGRAESVLESMARVALVLGGLPPEVQVWIGRMRVDLMIGNVIIELDGFEHHSNRADYRRDRRRCNALTAARLSGAALLVGGRRRPPEYVVAKVREALVALGVNSDTQTSWIPRSRARRRAADVAGGTLCVGVSGWGR